jgi:hypothetical protein
VLLAGFAGAILASVLLGPGEEGVRVFGVTLPSFCLFRNLTGWRCPGCGLTRSFVFLGHGHPIDALRMHPLGPLLYLVAIRAWAAARALAARLRSRAAPTVPGSSASPS